MVGNQYQSSLRAMMTVETFISCPCIMPIAHLILSAVMVHSQSVLAGQHDDIVREIKLETRRWKVGVFDSFLEQHVIVTIITA